MTEQSIKSARAFLEEKYPYSSYNGGFHISDVVEASQAYSDSVNADLLAKLADAEARIEIARNAGFVENARLVAPIIKKLGTDLADARETLGHYADLGQWSQGDSGTFGIYNVTSRGDESGWVMATECLDRIGRNNDD